MTLNNIQYGQKLTCKQFVEEFNAISEDHVADICLGCVEIYDAGSGIGSVLNVARLDPGSWYWRFEYERTYSWKELMLMAQLAANPPMF